MGTASPRCQRRTTATPAGPRWKRTALPRMIPHDQKSNTLTARGTSCDTRPGRGRGPKVRPVTLSGERDAMCSYQKRGDGCSWEAVVALCLCSAQARSTTLARVGVIDRPWGLLNSRFTYPPRTIPSSSTRTTPPHSCNHRTSASKILRLHVLIHQQISHASFVISYMQEEALLIHPIHTAFPLAVKQPARGHWGDVSWVPV